MCILGMSNNFAKYGQQKKRLAIKQIQQRAKRQASSQKNPFTWSRDDDIGPPSSENETPIDSNFLIPKSADPPNPFVTDLQPSEQLKVAQKQENIFVKNTLDVSPPKNASISQQTNKLQILSGRRNPSTKSQNRDQLINDFSGTSVNLADTVNSQTFQRKRGTCMQMCSIAEFTKRTELEIYSSAETQDGNFVHHLAVKEYKRASADQVESKPEDLRPSIVLLKTVEYLFMDLLERNRKNFEEIYDFLWDRTRAIRKDITQQRLCDMNTVLILETITRFHIYSAYIMAGASVGSFEQKYNNENLEKSLTSLRHLYDDLSACSETCSNEAEFRMYHILLNLNSGQVMREVSKYPSAILGSQYVRYALSCYNAYNSKNFVRFFKLFKQGSLLACCIIYRYIDNVRQKGLVSIINSHTIPSRGPANTTACVDYPVSKLMRFCAFESSEEAVNFVKNMKVEVSPNMEVLILRNRQYEVSDNKIKYRLATIDSKINMPVGRIIYTGALIPDSVIGGHVPKSPSNALPNENLGQIRVPQLALEKISQQYIANFVLNDVQRLITECFCEMQYLEKAKIYVIKELLDEACRSALKEELIIIKSDNKKKIMIHTKELYEQNYPTPLLDKVLRDLVIETFIEEARLSFVEETRASLLNDAVDRELQSILSGDSRYLSWFHSTTEKLNSQVSDKLLNETVGKELQYILSETQAQLHVERKNDLKLRLQANIVQKRYFFKIWKSRYDKIYSKRHTLDNVPTRSVPSSSSDVLRSLLGVNQDIVQDSKHLKLSKIAEIDLTSPTKSYQKKIDVRKKLLMRMELLEEAMSLEGIPLNCFSAIANPIYVTLAVEFPSSPLTQFVMDSFGLSGICKDDNLEEYVCRSVHLNGCVLKIQLLDLSKVTNNILKIAVKSCNLIVLQSNCQNHIDSVADLCVSTPKILISSKRPCSWSNLYVAQPVSMTKIQCCNLYKSLNSAVQETLLWERKFSSFKLVDVKDFVQSVMCIKLTDILLAKQVVLKNCKQYSVDPNIIISFYNCIIQNILSAVASEDLKQIDWPSQFDQRTDININWNEVKKMKNLVSELQLLRLPKFTGEPDSIDDCFNYCSTLKTFNLDLLMSIVTTVIESYGVQWCLILNQLIHHLIENAIFLDSHTILLDSQVSEIYSLKYGESIVESALIYNELDDELADYEPQSGTINEEDISEIWQSLSYYESKMSVAPATKSKNLQPNYLACESEQVDVLSQDLKKLTSSISETEMKLQRIVDECKIPSYLVKSLLD